MADIKRFQLDTTLSLATILGLFDLLNIGWQWVKTALMEGWQLISSAYFRSNYDPEPVMASSKQVKRRRRKLELMVQTYVDRTD